MKALSLNKPQEEAVLHEEGPCLVIAGAGSGKTRVLTERIRRLVTEGTPPWRILGFTFTNRAASEMRRRLEESLGERARRLWLGTFHSTGLRILRREWEEAGIDRDFGIYDADDQLSLLKRIIKDLSIPEGISPNSARSVIEGLKRSLILPSEFESRAEGIVEARVARIYKAYEAGLRSAKALDFTDLISRPVRLFQENQDLMRSWADRFDFVLVDEFQDTNPLQMQFISHLSSLHGNLFVVGDDDQSIYGWRGAEISHILEFEKQWKGARTIRLEQNYRSTRPILEVANAVIANNRDRKGKTLWTALDEGEKVRVQTVLDEEEEAESIARRIRSSEVLDSHWNRHAVLYRTHAQSRSLEAALGRYRIPYRIIGGTRFYDRKEIRDLLAYLKLAANPADTVSFQRVLNVPPRGIGKTSAARLLDLARREKMAPGLLITAFPDLLEELPAAASRRLRDFGKLLLSLSPDPRRDHAPSVLQRLLEKVPYLDYLEQSDPSTFDTRRENVEELLNASQAFYESRISEPVPEDEDRASAESGSLSDFLADVALVADIDSLEEDSETVTLMTLHNAKGLEYDSVYLSGVEELLLPHAMNIEEDSKLEEERRLFYVGVTRAMRLLFLTHALNRRRFGDTLSVMPSRFLSELPEDWVEREGEELSFRSGTSSFANRRSSYQGRAAAPVHRAPSSSSWDDFSQESGSENDFSQDESGLRVGMRVRHPSLGLGKVHKLEGSGEDLRVIVMFDRKGARKLLVRVAGLEPA
ncbi:MAG: UvrD-helicase domain-containing protein [Candidatus Krumholzibacteria bacterium]|nr:UvrD-helicase domain-containing protein [Candidatus Krumholzibacteria bacterium]